jgi:hypothetical protein
VDTVYKIVLIKRRYRVMQQKNIFTRDNDDYSLASLASCRVTTTLAYNTETEQLSLEGLLVLSESSRPNIFPVLHSVEMDRLDSLVRPFDSAFQCFCCGSGRDHSAARCF